jgi:CheY-like chemotaxis protein
VESKCDWCIFDKVALGKTIETTIKSPFDHRHYRVTNMPIDHQDGTISKMTILRDITNYLNAVSEKEKAQAQLTQAQKLESIGNLAGGIAHDFNNIFSSIIGFTELALDQTSKGTTLEDNLQEVYSAGKRAKTLVEQILAFARQSEEKRSPIQPRIIIKNVSDTGVGIAPELITSIFEPYFTTKGPGEGTGFGMAVVHGIVESYGGKITVESELGKGTTFIIYLPVTKKRSPDDNYVTEDLPTGIERILFVDDEAPIAKMGGQILERFGYSVTTRTSSVEAVELFQAKPNDFDLVVTDMTMPNLTGDKLAIELMKIRSDIPVILCTGYSKKISDELASEIGIKAFAYKPMVKADLAKTVRKVLDETKGGTKQ